MSRFTISMVALIAMASTAIAAEVKSGLAPGKAVSAFTVHDITGPNKGKSLCYRCAYEDRPVACIFTREMSDDIVRLIQQIDAAVAANKTKDLKAFVVFLADEDKVDAATKQLTGLAESKSIKNVPLTIFAEPSGPPAYKLSDDAAVTILMWKKAHVAVNHAFGSATLTADQIKAVVGDTRKILD